jgi:hypothetical protein
VVTYDCPAGASCPITLGAGEGGDIDAAHIAAHGQLLDDAADALDDVNNSLKVRYDNYDTKSLAKIQTLETTATEGILFKVLGEQKNPGQ